MFSLSHHHTRLGRYLRYICRWLMLFMLVPTSVGAQPLEGEQSTSDSRLEKWYQQVLFAYYQDDLQGALLQYSLLEHYYPQGLQQLPASLYADPSELELLKGSISLALGLEDQAAEIFSRLLANYALPEKRTTAWFALGLSYYQQGQWSKAYGAFSQIDDKEAQRYLSADAQDQLIYLGVQLANLHALGTQQTQWQQQLSADSIYLYYLFYNRALAFLESGQTEQAISQLQQLVAEPEEGLQDALPNWLRPFADEQSEADYMAKQQEVLAIQDRVNLTLAYTLLQQGNSHEAYSAFSRIRREGLDGDAALLGYGWAAAKGEELQIALGVWQSLMALPEHSEYSLEAYLAAAYVYEKGFAPRQSVATLQLGMQRFKQVLAELKQASHTIQQTAFIQALAHHYSELKPSIDLPTLTTDDDTAPSLLLTRLVQNSALHKTTRNHLAALQQSQNINQQLNDWQQRLSHFSLMLDERQDQRVLRAQNMLQAGIFNKLNDLKNRRDKLALQLATAQQQQDGASLMPIAHQQSQARLHTAQARLEAINQQKNALQEPLLKAQYEARLKRLAGILSWQASEAFSENSWQAQKALSQLDTEISNTAEQQSRLLAMLADRPDYAEQRQRVAELASRIDEKLARNQGLQQQLVSTLSTDLALDVSQFKTKVEGYVVQAQLALVRLNDQALQQNQNERDTESKVTPPEIGRPPALEPQARQQP